MMLSRLAVSLACVGDLTPLFVVGSGFLERQAQGSTPAIQAVDVGAVIAEQTNLTKRWMDAVVVKSSPSSVAGLFCDDGILVATAGMGIRYQKFSEDGWGLPKKDGVTIESYFDWFATLPGQEITAYHDNVAKVGDNVWVNNAWVNWAWDGNPGLTARMTFLLRGTPAGPCIFELHSSQLPLSPEEDSDEENYEEGYAEVPPLERATAHDNTPARIEVGEPKTSAEAITAAWMAAVVNESNPEKVDSLFCDDGLLVATAAIGIRAKINSTDGWGQPKAQSDTIKSYFEWFARLPGQDITKFHNNVARVTEDIWVNNAFVNWVWEGNPGLVARMTFIIRSGPQGACIFELHSSQLPDSP
eukprot:TRINITY_DN297_c0_g1_i3.p1 TRINITY_DN297_c0_g1~~TRINITY_DN297_c0_g1_i3.p1  ORF type:complete len:358 (+),score=73.86 TRINITY_DN297_c0_g1_i3:145-1218(+)